MSWSIILILDYIGFPLCMIVILMLYFSRWNGECILGNFAAHRYNEKVLKVWHIIALMIVGVIPILNITIGTFLFVLLCICHGYPRNMMWTDESKFLRFLNKNI